MYKLHVSLAVVHHPDPPAPPDAPDSADPVKRDEKISEMATKFLGKIERGEPMFAPGNVIAYPTTVLQSRRAYELGATSYTDLLRLLAEFEEYAGKHGVPDAGGCCDHGGPIVSPAFPG